jgi:hypothetical protein
VTEGTRADGAVYFEEMGLRGERARVPAARLAGCILVRSGSVLKVATFKDEDVLEDPPVQDVREWVERLRRSGLGADVLAFSDVLEPNTRFPNLVSEEDNYAVVDTSSFDEWWNTKLSPDSRRNVRRASKRGVVVRPVELDDALVQGIKDIYDETPIRQGRPFWHYGKSLDEVRTENGTFRERSWFLGAFEGAEMIGFVRITRVRDRAVLIQNLAKVAHQDKRPMNALIAATIERCAAEGIARLVYGRYRYPRKGLDSLAEFKRRLGFEEVTFRRYYMPLTAWGYAALRVGLQHGPLGMLPVSVSDRLRQYRARVLAFRARTTATSETADRADSSANQP